MCSESQLLYKPYTKEEIHMKKLGLFFIAFLLITGILSDRSLAQAYTQWHLPKGAKIRLGKGWIRDISFSPDGAQFAVATMIGIWIYDAHTGTEIALLNKEPRRIRALTFSQSGEMLASCDATGEVQVWNTVTGKPPLTLQWTERIAPGVQKSRTLSLP